MFVSYILPRYDEPTYGYMCFRMDVKASDDLLEYIRDRTHDNEAKLLYVSGYSDYPQNYVWIHTEGVYQTILYERTLKDAEEIGKLYSYLYKKYGFTNILGFLPCITQKATNTN